MLVRPQSLSQSGIQNLWSVHEITMKAMVYIMHSPRKERMWSSRLVCFATRRCSFHVTPRDTVGPSDCIPWHCTCVRRGLATHDFKGFSRRVQLNPLGLYLSSLLRYSTLERDRFVQIFKQDVVRVRLVRSDTTYVLYCCYIYV
jgi:hypothetical protein